MVRDASTYPRRVLLAIAGLSPQIVTETLYALAVQEEPTFIPTEVRLLTTSEGAERARLSLLSQEPGWFTRLLHDYALPPIDFTTDHIQVVTTSDGQALSDIRSRQDNVHVADCLAETIRDLTADPNCALHVSLAGGRKTMGYYAGYALSLFARPQDRLSHVLVSEPYEMSWDFFYPTPYPRVITTRDNKLVDTQAAEVTLAQIPFVRLRDGLPDRLLNGQATFGETVLTAQHALEPPRLVIDCATRCIQAAGEIIELPPTNFAFYAMMARRRQQGLHAVRWDSEDVTEQYLHEYHRITDDLSGERERVEQALANGMTPEYFDERKSRVNSTLTQRLGATLANPYLIQASGRRPRTRYGLTLAAEAVQFAELTNKQD